MNQEDQDYDPYPSRKIVFKELSQDALEQLSLRKNFDKLYKLAEKAPPKCVQEYKQFKYNDEIYNIGESILLNLRNIDFLARIKRIISIKSFKDDQELPLVLINLYCNKDKIAPQYSEFFPSISIYELFLTEEEHAILIDSIKHKISVLTYDEYDECDDKEANYFMRAAYNTLQESFLPEPRLWPASCYCKLPNNPDQAYVLCDICQKWIHQTCAKISDQEAKNQTHFVCMICQGR